MSEEVEIFFSEFKKLHKDIDKKSQHKLDSQKNISSYKNFLPGIPSVKVSGPAEPQIDYSINVNAT